MLSCASLALGCAPSDPEQPDPRERLGKSASALAAPPAFPLKLSANQRYLVDQNGTPFLINQASSWALIQAVPTSDAADYLDALKQKGFNTIMVSVISKAEAAAGNPPYWQGVPPFTTPWDYSTPNETYFAHADEIIDMAKDRGMLVTLVPSYLGYNGEPTQGWYDEMQASYNSVDKMLAYGRYLGRRYKSFSNIIWIAGGDNQPAAGSELETRLKAIIDGIKEQAPAQLWTAHWDSVARGWGVFSTENPTFASYMDIDGYYAYDYDYTYQRDWDFYSRTPAKMIYHLDQSYETEGGGTTWNIRRKAYQAMLMGAAGSSFCAGSNWYLFYNWRSNMNTTGTIETQYWYDFFNSRAWYDLVPDQNHQTVTAGYGTWGSLDYVTAARTSSGSSVIAYAPWMRTLTVDMTRISGTQAKGWWYDPTTGQAQLIGTFPTSGSRNFATPTDASWALVLDDASLNLAAPGTPPAGTANAAPTVATAASAKDPQVSGTGTSLGALGADDGGEPSLTYTWSTLGTPPGSVGFAPNGTNAAKSTAVSFGKVGTYDLQVTITDAQGLSAKSNVTVQVSPTLSSVVASPASATVAAGSTQQFGAAAQDQFGASLASQPSFSWSTSGGGSIDSSGLFSASANAGGAYTITASTGGKSGTASVTVAAASTNEPPTVATAASAAQNPVTGSSTNLSVLGADDAGEANLSYSWGTTGTPPAAVKFSANGTNAAKKTVASFAKAGAYTLQAVIADAQGLTTTSSIDVNVSATVTSVVASPASVSLMPGAQQQFSAIASDQFGFSTSPQPTFAWAASGGGTIDATGLFSAGSSSGGPFNVSASASGKVGNASVTISPVAAFVARINAGGSATGSFSADRYFTTGNTYANSASISTTGVSNAGPVAVYQSERYGNSFGYGFSGMSGGSMHKVRLHFAEIYWTAADRRVFNVSINGAAALSNFDIFKAAGAANVAVVRDFDVAADASGKIAIKFATVRDNAKVSAIEIL